MNILFLTLKTFSATGGIEKFNRCFTKAIWQNAVENNWQFTVLSAYDTESDENYVPQKSFAGFAGNRLAFMWAALKKIQLADYIILGHINLVPVFNIGKILFGRKKWVLMAHGKEMWEPLNWSQKKAVRKVDNFLCVSRFTKQILIEKLSVSAPKIFIFPNTIDPSFLQNTNPVAVTEKLREKYNLSNSHPVLLTVARISSSEKQKGYYEVLHAMPALLQKYPNLKYILCGKADATEVEDINEVINKLNLQAHVILTGFVEDNMLAAHYWLANVFVMPSVKEGFGIVFIEAASCGLQVIAGNADGSKDALLDGKLGLLINPSDPIALQNAITNAIDFPLSENEAAYRKTLVADNFGFDAFKRRQKDFLLASKAALL